MVGMKRIKRQRDGPGLISAPQLTEENAALLEINRLTSSSLNLDEIYRMVSEEIRSLVPYDRLAFSTVNLDKNTVTITHVAGQEIPGWSEGTTFNVSGTVTERIIKDKSGEMVQGDAERDATDEKAAQDGDLVCRISVPLVHHGEVFGCLSVRSRAPMVYTRQHLELAERVAAQIAGTIFNVRVYSKLSDEVERRKQTEVLLQEKTEELVVRNRIATIFLTIPDDEMYSEVLKLILEVMKSRFGVFGYVDEDGALVVPTMTRMVWDQCRMPDKNIVFPRHAWGNSSWPRAMIEMRANYSNVRSVLTPEGHIPINRYISMPIVYRNESIGLIQVADSETDYQTRDIQLLQTIADAIAPVLYARLQRDREERKRSTVEREMAALIKISKETSSSIIITDIYESTSEEMRNLIPFDRLNFSIVDHEKKTSTTSYLTGQEVPGWTLGTSVGLHKTLAGRIVEARLGRITQGTELEEEADQQPALECGLVSRLSVPIMHRGVVIGNMTLRSKIPDAYSQHHMELAGRIAGQISGTIANTQLLTQQMQTAEALRESEREAKRLADEQAALADISREITTSPNIDTVLESLAKRLRQLIQFDRLAITTVDPNKKKVTVVFEKGVSVSKRQVGATFNFDGSNLERAYRKKSPAGYDLSKGFARDHPSYAAFAELNLRTTVIAPLKARDQLIGGLHVSSTHQDAYSTSDIETIERIGTQVAGAIGIALMYQELSQAEERLRRLNEELEQRVTDRTAELVASNKELEAFSYSVSHDLRTPLRSIDGFSQALLEDYPDILDEQGKDYLQRVRSAAQRMGGLIEDMLNLSRVTRREMKRNTVDLSSMAQQTTAQFKESQPERNVDFVIEQGLTTQGDEHLLRVLLENLIGNAWKFTGKHDHATIEFGHTHVDSKDAYFVKDDGAGFDMAYSEKLFGAFQRLHGVDQFPGTGIGLATVQRIVRRHRGSVWAHGEMEKGATFYFTLQAE